MLTQLLSDLETPVSAYAKLRHLSATSILLESAEGDSKIARFSVIGVAPVLTAQFSEGVVTFTHRDGPTESQPFTNPLTVLQTAYPGLQAQLRHGQQALPQCAHLPFLGGWMGYMGFGACQYFDAITPQPLNPLNVPQGFFGLYETFVVFDHLYRQLMVISLQPTPVHNQVVKALATPCTVGSLVVPPLADDAVFNGVTQGCDQTAFGHMVMQAKQWITEGQVFQIVPSHRFSVPLAQAEPFTVYRVAQAINPSPYGYFLQMPGFDYAGCSPETYLSCTTDQTVILRALAGTRPRGQTPEADAQLKASLLADPKELAEHRMLVDLGRNDLGRVCQVGTIAVGEIARVVEYTHVMHLSTEMRGQLRPDKTAFDMVQSCFPRGTLTGAPKIRAMQLLAQLEPEQRGIYGGFVGYFDLRGNMDSAIAIRSVLMKDGVAHVNAGAGVVYDSDPVQEYEETRNKARSIIKAVQLAKTMATPAL
jgi:anthranilate synthase component I